MKTKSLTVGQVDTLARNHSEAPIAPRPAPGKRAASWPGFLAPSMARSARQRATSNALPAQAMMSGIS